MIDKKSLSRSLLFVMCLLAFLTACSGSGGGGDGGADAMEPWDPDSGEPMPPVDPGEGAVLPEVGLVFPDGKVVREPFPGLPAGEPAPPEAPAISNATLDLSTGMLSFDLEVAGSSEMIEFQLQFATGEIVQFSEPVSDATALPIPNVVPGWTYTVTNELIPWQFTRVDDCHADAGPEVTDGCFDTCVDACSPPPDCNRWFCLDMNLDEASCDAWMQTETAENYGRSLRLDCAYRCSHAVGTMDFHRSGGTEAARFFLDGTGEVSDPEATEQASLATMDALLSQTTPEALATNYIEAVFEQLYCGLFGTEVHRGLWGIASGLNCLSNGEGSWEPTFLDDKWHETQRNYLLCALDDNLPDLPEPPPPVTPRKTKRVSRSFVQQGITIKAGGSIMVAKDGSVTSYTEPVDTHVPGQGPGE